MRKLLSISFLLLITTLLVAQQDPLYNNYILNSLPLNPAFAGSKECMRVSLSYKRQWVGVTNAPQTSVLSIDNSSKENKIGYGLSMINDQLGISRRTGAMANASYKLKTKNGNLSFGLGLGLYNLSNRWSEINSEEGDAVFNMGDQSVWNSNFSAGLYYYQDEFFVSLSAPMIFNNAFDEENFESFTKVYTNKVYLTGGYNLPINEMTLKPSMMVRYNENNPIQLDFNLLLEVFDRLEIGTFYRPNISFTGFAKVGITEQIQLGYSMESPISKQAGFTGESHEVTLILDLTKKTNAKNTSIF